MPCGRCKPICAGSSEFLKCAGWQSIEAGSAYMRPDPESHGCIRLTNWDAARLAQMVKPGTVAKLQP